MAPLVVPRAAVGRVWRSCWPSSRSPATCRVRWRLGSPHPEPLLPPVTARVRGLCRIQPLAPRPTEVPCPCSTTSSPACARTSPRASPRRASRPTCAPRWPTSTRRATRCRASAPPGSSVIAEVKRRSPSKGDLADIPDPAALARGVRRRRRRRDQRAHRAAPLRRQPRRPARGAGRGRHPGAAQGLHRRPPTSCSRPAPPAPTSRC